MTLWRSDWRGRCPLCGAENCSCGPTANPEGNVTITQAEPLEDPVGELKNYTFTDENTGREVTLRLSDADAKKRGLKSSGGGAKKAAEPADKARSSTPTKKATG